MRVFFDFIPRFSSTEYTCRRKDAVALDGSPIEEHIGIDVFVIDRSHTGIKKKFCLYKMEMVYLQAMKYRQCVVKQSFVVRAARRIMGLTVGRKTLDDLVRRYDDLSKSCPEDTGTYLITNIIPANCPNPTMYRFLRNRRSSN